MKGKKTGGRKKGTPNRKTLILQEVLETLDLDIPMRLRDELSNLDDVQKFGYTPDIKFKAINLRVQIYLELMNYLYPKRKAIEMSGPHGSPLQMFLEMSPDERARRREVIQRRLETKLKTKDKG